MPLLPTYAFENRVGFGNRTQLELGRWWKLVPGQFGCRFGLLLRVVLPLDVPSPSGLLFSECNERIFASYFISFLRVCR